MTTEGKAMAEETMGTLISMDELKRQWLSDGTWDIETTPGFEAHRQELYIFRLESEAKTMNEELRRYRTFFRMFRDLVRP